MLSSMRRSLAMLLVSFTFACGGRGVLDAAGATGGGGMSPDASLPSCAFTSEPSPPAPGPCMSYVGIQGDLAACGIPTMPGPLPPEVCTVECVSTGTCALLDDPGLGFGSLVVGCGCQ